ncbi:4-aminobutyrate--2-oxoglutarate transaminase [Caldinitratiruptor microaerophilus]|uniref:(S)-3-amino-2-methylpropionate transaminase n=1 Tax=Caldinitratiruptor microaerophilus TaxID=671077 RepID=A0AA35G6I3_9FIRM|nr:4-aminobutyrate--2-oxoglutarate transaminase [Caldinitratiruptor microaerophilus]BDG61351.1 4-aminobutyrate--2-oxoglutarate transaminase [Caldinitratiruptor microaerophilus]
MAHIRLVTSIPGPRSRALLERKERAVAQAFQVHVPVIVERAEGALLTDVDGNTFIDLAGGVGCMNVGHSVPEVVRAIHEASARFTHTDFSIVPYESYIRLAEELSRRAPGNFPKKAAFFNSGAEAVENAVKIARKYTGRRGIIAMEGAFHGRTLMALSLTSRVKPYKQGMGPFAPDVYRVPFPYVYRWPGSPPPEEVARQAVAALERAFVTQVAPEDTAAVILEPVQGEGGFVVPPEGYLPQVQAICRRHGILLIADEVQTGFGRTGRFFASERLGIEPDLITVGKSIAAGLPLSGVIGRADVMDAATDGNIGGTYVGNPVACSAALAVLDVMDREDLPARAEALGRRLRARLEALAERTPLIGEVRGLGAMVAVELVRDRSTREPATAETTEIIREAIRRGVIVLRAGIYGNVIRFLMPLVITEEQLDEALGVLEEAFAAVTARV